MPATPELVEFLTENLTLPVAYSTVAPLTDRSNWGAAQRGWPSHTEGVTILGPGSQLLATYNHAPNEPFPGIVWGVEANAIYEVANETGLIAALRVLETWLQARSILPDYPTPAPATNALTLDVATGLKGVPYVSVIRGALLGSTIIATGPGSAGFSPASGTGTKRVLRGTPSETGMPDLVETPLVGSARTTSGLLTISPGPFDPPVNTAKPVVSGNFVQGGTLNVSTGTWTSSPTSYTYQWYMYNGSTNPVGTNQNSYVAGAGAGSYYCVVTASNAGGPSAPETSNVVQIT